VPDAFKSLNQDAGRLNGTRSWQRLGGSASSVASKRRRYKLIFARR
jgi:hypothetical protein